MLKTLKSNQKRKKKGFTLIELIIVIAIIGILALIAIPRFGAARKNANIKADIANAKTIFNATATLIAENKITLPATGVTTTLNPEEASTAGDSKDLHDALQTVPTPKNLTGHFVVQITNDSNITVSITTDAAGASTNLTQVYPSLSTGDYKAD